MASWLRRFAADPRQRLWFRPAFYCTLAVLLVGVAYISDGLGDMPGIPGVTAGTIEKLLTVISSTMLAVATFAVSSMLAAYSAATTNTSPRTFKLVLADDISQSALSSFIGAFIFAVIGLISVRVHDFAPSGRFVLFILTLGIFVWVIATFVRWVDRIARLGRMGSTLSKTETAARDALNERVRQPALGGVPVAPGSTPDGAPVSSADRIGFVRHIEIAALQELAEAADARIRIAALPGAFVSPGDPLAYVSPAGAVGEEKLCATFEIGAERSFLNDPYYGLTVLSEIGARALSPGINDAGTAVGVICTLHRLIWAWAAQTLAAEGAPPRCDRVQVPLLDVAEIFDHAFTAIARDGAGVVEVMERLQRTFLAFQAIGHPAVARAARQHAASALERARRATGLPDDLARVEALARRVGAAAPR
ncbi:DUF2254 domain-containing protein [Maritimibacter sp. 55A14]|uniref:DUF2254 domain-containing protein n=1 Tax=Maritimibacter sp. 55A14 TaxID=2174844 RepID=UPI00130485FE|nr:DUF2254 domain-containing protein [Maritimibacter sp. 55A14]